MDWGHLTLGGLVVALAAAWLLRRRRRSLHIRIDWEETNDDADRRNIQRGE